MIGRRHSQFKKVLIGYDGSTQADRATETALALASSLGAKVLLFAVARPPEHGDSSRCWSHAVARAAGNVGDALCASRHAFAYVDDVGRTVGGRGGGGGTHAGIFASYGRHRVCRLRKSWIELIADCLGESRSGVGRGSHCSGRSRPHGANIVNATRSLNASVSRTDKAVELFDAVVGRAQRAKNHFLWQYNRCSFISLSIETWCYPYQRKLDINLA
jgi:hypothetical protein